VPARDGWLAVSLARPEDVAALPAWLGCDVPADDPWPAVYDAAGRSTADQLDQGAALLGLPFAALGSVEAPATEAFGLPLGAVQMGARATSPDAGSGTTIGGTVVLDLSSLWAGPLCAQLLAAGGADVIKVESVARPDGARGGPRPFFDLLNGEKRSVVLDLAAPSGRRDLRRLMDAADVVIESARPRALEQMGFVAADLVGRTGGPRVWASVTSHGRGPGVAERVGFGDVAAVAGGLVAGDEAGPVFLADAVADPLCGLVTAAAVLAALGAGGRWVIDAAMAPMAARVAGPPLALDGARVGAPRARDVVRPAPGLGADTEAVLSGLGP
jgi:hypothetical protein